MAIALIALALSYATFLLGAKFLLCQHQRGIIIELKEWQDKYTNINSAETASDAIEMWEYMNRYYWPGEGYYCSKKMTEKVENQYGETIGAIITALEKYSGLKYDDDLQKWKEWSKSNN